MPSENVASLPSDSELFHHALQESSQRRRQQSEQEAVNRRLSERIASTPNIHFPADNIEVEFVTNPDRGVEFDRRHQDLNISQRVVSVIQSGIAEHIDALTKDVKDRGGFLIDYDGVGADRIRRSIDRSRPYEGGWLMVEATGCPVDKATGIAGERIVGGDGHFWVPPDRVIESGDLPLPSGEDHVYEGRRIIEEIMADPACAVLIADICSVAPNMGFASAIEHTALEQISHLNDVRSHKLRYAIAAIAGIRGLLDQSGRPLAEQSDLDIANVASVILHTRGQIPGKLLGLQMNHVVPSKLPDGTPVSLLVDWYVTAQKLEGIRPRKNVRVINGLFPDAAHS